MVRRCEWLRIVSATTIESCFIQKNITPRFEFGFGLSYTQFEYSNLQVYKIDYQGGLNRVGASNQGTWDAGGCPPSGEGSSAAIWYVTKPWFDICLLTKNPGYIALLSK